MKIVKKILSYFAWAIILVIVCFNIVQSIDQATGYNFSFFGLRSSVIISNSMSSLNETNYEYLNKEEFKPINKYDLIYTFDYSNYEDIKIKDVIIYRGTGGLICHRVVDKYEDNGKQWIVTRGDANNVNDTPISYNSVKGKVISVIPKVGKVMLYFHSLYFILALCICVFFISLGMYIYTKDEDSWKKDAPSLVYSIENNGKQLTTKIKLQMSWRNFKSKLKGLFSKEKNKNIKELQSISDISLENTPVNDENFIEKEGGDIDEKND